METNLNFNLTSDLLTKDIRFHRDASKDDESVRKLFELSELLDDVFFDLKLLKNETLSDPNNLSGTRIRNQIDNLTKDVQKNINYINTNIF